MGKRSFATLIVVVYCLAVLPIATAQGPNSRGSDNSEIMSLMVRRPAGRESIPGDIHFMTSRLFDRATGVWAGGYYILSTGQENQRKLDGGGGGTIGIDWTRWNAGPLYIGPSFHVDLYGQAFNDDVQLNQVGNIVNGQRVGDDVFGINLRPGLLARLPWNDNANFWVEGCFLVNMQESGTQRVQFNPNKAQLPVNQFQANDWSPGWTIAGGLEYQTERGYVLRPGVIVKGLNSQLYTGIAFVSDIEVYFMLEVGRSDRRSNIMSPPTVSIFGNSGN